MEKLNVIHVVVMDIIRENVRAKRRMIEMEGSMVIDVDEMVDLEEDQEVEEVEDHGILDENLVMEIVEVEAEEAIEVETEVQSQVNQAVLRRI